jgi:hypothetical protein
MDPRGGFRKLPPRFPNCERQRTVSLDIDSKGPAGRDAPPRLHFHTLTLLDEGDEVVVGRADIDSWAVMPADGAALLGRLRDGEPPGEAACWYSHTFGEDIDIDDFVESLKTMNFVRDAEAAASEPSAGHGSLPAPPNERVRWQRLGAAVFSKPAFAVYLVVLTCAVAVVLLDPELAPRRQHVFFSHSLLVCELSLLVLSFPLVFLHELAHVLAGRRLGLRTRVRVSYRLYFLVFETVMNGLVSVPRARRYLPMLAGMLTDLLVACCCTVTAWFLRAHLHVTGWLPGMLLALSFTTLLRIAWQAYIFLRTDIFYLVTTVLGCVDLQTTTRQYLANALYRLLGRSDLLHEPTGWHPRDRYVARWYAPLVVLGYGAATAVLVFVTLPIAWTFFSTAVGRALLDRASTGPERWDSILLLVLNLAQLAVVAVLFLREGRLTARRRLIALRNLIHRPQESS